MHKIQLIIRIITYKIHIMNYFNALSINGLPLEKLNNVLLRYIIMRNSDESCRKKLGSTG